MENGKNTLKSGKVKSFPHKFCKKIEMAKNMCPKITENEQKRPKITKK